MDCLIIGGGLIGMMTARELSRAGLSVEVVERGDPGRESSWAGGGILSPICPWQMPGAVTRLAAWGQGRYPELAAELRNETGIDPEWTRSGMLILDSGEAGRARRWADEQGVVMEELESPQAVAAVESGCRSAQTGLWMPDVAQVRNPRLIRALLRSLEIRKIPIHAGTAVDSILLRNGRVRGIQTDAGELEADRVVIAGGAWSAQLLAPLDVNVDIRPIRGQMLLYRASPGLLTRIVIDRGQYLIPRRDGHVLAGSTIEDIGFDKSTTDTARKELARDAETLAPVLANYEIVRHWAGLRPGTPSGIPYICEITGIEGLYLNAGHFRNGVLLAPASARLLSDIVLERDRIVDSFPYIA